jgi:hypothetical protein
MVQGTAADLVKLAVRRLNAARLGRTASPANGSRRTFCYREIVVNVWADIGGMSVLEVNPGPSGGQRFDWLFRDEFTFLGGIRFFAETSKDELERRELENWATIPRLTHS